MRRTYVSITTENYHYLTLWMVKSLQKFSNYDINIFCINYDPAEKNLATPQGVGFHRIDYAISEDGGSFQHYTNGNFYVNRKKVRNFQIMTRKSEACIRVLEMGYDEACFIDGDSIACPNIDEIFEYSGSIKSTPLASKGPHEFLMITDQNGNMRGNPFENSWPAPDLTKTIEWPLMQFLQVDASMRDEYRQGNLFIFNQNCREFLKILEEFLNVMWKLVDVFYYSPFQDETPLNVLIWKFSGGGLPASHVNIGEGHEAVKRFYHIQNDKEILAGQFYRIPKDKKQIKVFHGEKREQEIEKIIQHLDFLKENGYFEKD